MSSRPVRLAEVAAINPPLEHQLHDDEMVAFVPMAAVDANAGTTNGAGDTRRFKDVKKGFTPFLAGDLLVAKITPCFENGKIAQATIPTAVGFGSTEFHVVRPVEGRLDPRYLLHYLRQNHVRASGERRMTGSAGQRRVPEHFLTGLEVPVPPLAEQRRIATILDRVDALRARRRAALAQLDTLTQAIFLEMFGDPLRDRGKWPVQPLQDLVDKGRPISYGILMPGPNVPDGVPYVRVVDMQSGAISLVGIRRTANDISHEYRRSLLKTGDLLLSIRGHVGRLATVPLELDGANITQDSARIAIVGANPTFVRECLRTFSMQEWMRRRTKGVAVKGINLGDVKRIPVILPPQHDQERFAAAAERVSRGLQNQRASNSELDALFASLQHRAFRGEL